ncbi:MAG: tyrosine-type recombinase/integrase, partial [Gemmatimonadetes bacterium]|nr:tyrosine-type recombinase/integrase [Gemmatimonadota bacterium]
MAVTDLAKTTYPVPLDRNPLAVYLAGLKPTGRRSMLSKLHRVAVLLGHADALAVPWAELRFQHVAAVRSKLQEERLAAATVNTTLAGLKGVARAAFNLGLMSGEDLERIRSVKAVRGEKLLAGRALTREEVSALLRVCVRRDGAGGARDAALIALMSAGGLRRAEVVALDRADYDPEAGELVVRGKGNKERLLYVTGGAARALTDWLEHRGDEEGALFQPVSKGGRVLRRRMTDQAVYGALLRRGRQAKVRRFSPHDLRRTFVSNLLDAGADVVTVQQLAGHANVQTTARYDRRGEEAKRRAVELVDTP